MRVVLVRWGAALATLDGLAIGVGLSAKGANTLRADARLSAAAVTLRRGRRRALEIAGIDVEGTLDIGGGRSEVTLSRVSMESPPLRAEGAFHSDAAGPRAGLTARGSGLDVTGLREKLLAFLGDDGTVRDIFAIVRGGTLTDFSFDAAGASPADLGVFERMRIRATLAGGSVFIAGPGLALQEARGDVSIEGGVLSAERAAARIGSAEAWDGHVRVGLARSGEALRVEAAVRADLGELPAVLSRAIPEGTFHDELSLVEDLSGSATGRIGIEGRAGQVRTKVSVTAMSLAARYRRIPFPVRIDEGGFFYDGERLGVSRLHGSVGRSKLSGAGARLRLGPSPGIEEISGELELSLDELFPWVTSARRLASLRTNLREVRGSAALSVDLTSGPLDRPEEWRGDVIGTLRNVFVDTPLLPRPLEVTTGDFEVDPETVRFAGLETRMLDASLRVSGTLDGWRRGPGLEAEADGVVGPEALRWGWERAALPADLRPAAPLALRDVRFGLDAGALSLAGSFGLEGGPRVTLDLFRCGDETDIRELGIADPDSLASMGFRRREGELALRFEGHLEAGTLERLFDERRPRRGRIEGDLRALVPLEHPGRTTADGTLNVTDLAVPTAAERLEIDHLGLRASGSLLSVRSSSFRLAGMRFSAAGDVWFDDGSVHLQLDSFALGDLAWKDVLADVSPEEDGFTAAVQQAGICGVSTTGAARIHRDGLVTLAARAASRGPDISAPLACFGVKNVRTSGRYEASLEIDGEGKASGLLCAARGPIRFEATKGRIGQASLLTRILGALNGTGFFKGKEGDRVGEAMAFDEFSAAGEAGDGAVSIREGILRTPSFTMAATGTFGVPDRSVDLMVLAHPLSTVDKIIQAIPVVRYILGKDFLAVAARVTGSLDAPSVGVTPARDVSRGLVEILGRTVTLPVKVIEP